MGNFGLAIFEWNCMPKVHNMWVGFKQFFRKAHRELQETTNITVQNAVMHHANMVHNVVAVLQEFSKQEQSLTKTPETISEPNDHVVNAVHITQQQLVAQL